MNATIAFLSDCFAARWDDGRIAFVPWREIRQIDAYKIDLWAVDEVCLGFRFGADDSWIEVSESDGGWRPLLESIRRRFPTIPAGWEYDVLFPPFAANERTLYRADAAAPKPSGESPAT